MPQEPAMDDVITRANALRHATGHLIEDLVRTGKELGLPTPLSDMEVARTRMEVNQYRVLIMGEAKRGKSTFLNALMGETLLPVDVNIATSQVFHIRRTDGRAYRLRYEDDTEQPITAAELESYGKQELGASEPAPEPGADPLSVKFLPSQVRRAKALRWIEIEGDFPFIPEEIAVLDTPGLGSLYAEHSRITQRFVPLADAVVFVLSSGGVITDFEMGCVEEILQYTRQIFFLQTQIDNYSADEWQQRLKANTEHLNRRFVGKIGAPREPIRVWPISSKLLLDATREQDPARRAALLTASRFQEAERAFRRFLFQVTGCVRIAAALQQAEQYAAQGRDHLASRIELLQKSSAEERSRMQQERAKRLQEFAKEYGPAGHRRSKLVQDVGDIIAIAKDRFQKGLATNGRLYRHYDGRIQKITTVKEGEALGEEMAAGVIHYAGKHWLRCTSACTVQLLARLSEDFANPDSWDVPAFRDTPTLRAAIRLERDPMTTKATFTDRVKMAWGGSSMVMAFGAAAGMMAGAAAAAIIAPVAAGAALVLGVHQFKIAGQRIVDNVRPQLVNYLAYTLGVVNAAYNEPDEQGFGLVTSYFKSLQNGILDRISALYEERKAQLESELEETARLIEAGADETRVKVRQLQERQADWKRFETQIKEMTLELSKLQKAPLPNPSGLSTPTVTLSRRAQQAVEEAPVDSFLTKPQRAPEEEVRDRAMQMILRNGGQKPPQEEVNAFFGYARRLKVADERTQALYKDELAKYRSALPAGGDAGDAANAPGSGGAAAAAPAAVDAARAALLDGYRVLVRAAYADGAFTRDEGSDLDEYARKNGLSGDEVLRIEREVRAEWARQRQGE